MPEPVDTVPTPHDGPAPVGLQERTSLQNYVLVDILGRGGMGDVVLGHDPTIGRDVAIKRLRSVTPTPIMVKRFLREAKIQARLEHPSIVPVYELGLDREGQPYFTMKRVTGVTLLQALAATPAPPRARLLRVFADVCRAIELAHSQRIVHRDLKPANIMMGGYGEVYVLDWGLARVDDEHDADDSLALERVHDADTETQDGALLGTPGYMSPEQAAGGAREVTTATDVYALGAILFEILAGEPLHPVGTAEALTSTLSEHDGIPSHRRPDREIAPELDGACAAALAIDPDRRITARELASMIEGYLDGDRDLDRRKKLAAEQLALAKASLASVDPAARSLAMKAAGRALAIDPTSREAIDTVSSIVFAPPTSEAPTLRAEEAALQMRQSKFAVRSLAAVLLFLGLSGINGILNWPLAGCIAALAFANAVAAWRLSTRPARDVELYVVASANALLVALLSRLFGPFVIAPGVVCIMALSLTSYPNLIDRGRWVIALLLVAWATPVILEAMGVLSSTWSVAEGSIVSRSGLVRIGGAATTSLLIVGNLITFVVIGAFANALARTRRAAQRTATTQAWHMRQFLPLE